MKQLESCLLIASDIHFGKKTPTYDPEICKQRLNQVKDRMGKIRSMLSDYEFDNLHICFLGDINDGTDIYATQPHHQAVTNVEQQAWELAEFLAPWVKDLGDVWHSHTEVLGVAGNHGRAGKSAAEAANFDIVAYKYMKLRLEHDHISVTIPDSLSPFILPFEIRGHKYLWAHGNQVQGWNGIPQYGIQRLVSNWFTSKRLGGFEVALMGHWHIATVWYLNKLTAILTGTPVTDDDYVLEKFGREAVNLWWLVGVSDSRPIAWWFDLDLA